MWKLYTVELKPYLAKKAPKSENGTAEYIFLYNLDPDFFEANLFISGVSWFHH